MDRRTVAAVAYPVALGLIVHHRTLSSFFGPDDLIHLSQAAGLSSPPSNLWRYPTQVAWFRAMVAVFGPDPVPFLVANLVLHAVNVALLWRLARRLGGDRTTAMAAAGLFAIHPLFVTVLMRAVTINDLSSLTLVLVAALLLVDGPRRSAWLAPVVFALALWCKESVLALPLAFLALRPRDRRVARAPVTACVAITGLAAISFLALRGSGLSPSGAAYDVGLGAWVPHNLMTYLAWAFDFHRPIPDLVRSPDPTAWRFGIPLLLALLVGAWISPRRHVALAGLAWWAAALLPVLFLRNSTYGHYAYVAMAGLAVAIAAATVPWMVGLHRTEATQADASGPVNMAPRWIVAGILLVLAGRADSVIQERLSLRTEAIDLPRDSFLRGIVVAQRSVAAVSSQLPADARELVVFVPEGTLIRVGANSGRSYGPAHPGAPGYLLIEAVLDGGRALRLFEPALIRSQIVRQWAPSDRDAALFVQSDLGEGRLRFVGMGPDAHAAYALELLQEGHPRQALEYLDSLRVAFPAHRGIRLLRGRALLTATRWEDAFSEFQYVAQHPVPDSLALTARAALRSIPRQPRR